MSQLSDLLASLDPAVIIDGPEQRANVALSTFPIVSAYILDCGEFKDFIARFHQYAHSCVLNWWPYYDYEWNYGAAINLMKSFFGPSGVDHAFVIVRTGTKGGLYGLMKQITKSIVDEHIRKATNAIVGSFVLDLDDDEREAAVQEYLIRYRHLLPPELVENDGLGLYVEFKEVLMNHPYMVHNVSLFG